MNNSIGESQIDPQTMAQITPDVISPQGQTNLQTTLQKATQQKAKLDTILKLVADKFGMDFSSRVKNPETIVQKIAQKRLQGEAYDIQDVNDTYGGRIVINDKNKIPKIMSEMKQLSKKGEFDILKSELVKNDGHKAFHIDIQTSDGTKAEIQVIKPNDLLESMASHGLRAVYGEKPPSNVDNLLDKQKTLAHKMSQKEAMQKSDTLADLTKQSNNKPLDPRLVAGVLTQ